jgi:gamma-glutamylcyclotransferase (GGCT)/AIG2-like uncharacterized protein YtfP
MDWQQMRKRCPSARFVDIALLPDHELKFTRGSERRQCGVADAVPRTGGKIWGVVYEIDDLDVDRLDRSEGYRPDREKNSYSRRECQVLADGCEEIPLTVWTYFADRQPNLPPPSNKYKELIVSGARHWRLPDEYIRWLEAIKTA